MIPHFSLPELLVIGFLAVLFFGRDKLPEVAGSFGKAFNIFKKEISNAEESVVEPSEEIKQDAIKMAENLKSEIKTTMVKANQ